ncbi:MAG: hypothetical protein ACSLE2_03700 [Lysobacterales bacterium]
MRNIAVIALLVLLAGCATERYYPVQVEGGGQYIAEREYAAARYDSPRYNSLWDYGLYPWWVHSFYTPYYYPYTFSYYHPFYYPRYGSYNFAGWYPSWPYYAGYQGSHRMEWPPYGAHYRYPAGQDAVAPQRQPEHVAPAGPMRQRAVADRRQQKGIGGRADFRDDLYRQPSTSQPGGVAAVPQRVKAPVDATRRSQGIAPRPSVALPARSAPPTGSLGSERGRAHRTPAERSRSERDE